MISKFIQSFYPQNLSLITYPLISACLIQKNNKLRADKKAVQFFFTFFLENNNSLDPLKKFGTLAQES